MGINESLFKLLLHEKIKGNLKGKKLLQLGRQHTFVTFKKAKELANQFGLRPPFLNSIKSHPSFHKTLNESNFIDDITLFSILGFETIHSVDISPYENATYIHDLNLPLKLTEKYDVVYDGGTLEHLFSIPQALKNIHELLDFEGVAIHANPSHNHVDHGFYMFCPTLFYEYYSANRYEILTSYIYEYSTPQNAAWHVFEYSPGTLKDRSFGGFGKNMIGMWLVVKKLQGSVSDVIPQQMAYQPAWSGQNFQKPTSSKIRILLKKIRFLLISVRLAKSCWNYFQSRKLKIKKIGVF